MKTCTKCLRELDESNFYQDSIIKRCKECHRNQTKIWRNNNKERIINYVKNNRSHEYNYFAQLRYTYGISNDDYLEMERKQNNLCDICGKPASNTAFGHARLQIDHNHKTGHIRGLLCGNCNKLLSHCLEDINILNNTISYLEKHSKSPGHLIVPKDKLDKLELAKARKSNKK